MCGNLATRYIRVGQPSLTARAIGTRRQPVRLLKVPRRAYREVRQPNRGLGQRLPYSIMHVAPAVMARYDKLRTILSGEVRRAKSFFDGIGN